MCLAQGHSTRMATIVDQTQDAQFLIPNLATHSAIVETVRMSGKNFNPSIPETDNF